MSSLEKLAGAHDEADLKILLINIQEERENVRSFMERKGYSNTVLLDSEGNAAIAYKAIGIPIAFLVDKEGRIAEKLIGYIDWNSRKMKQVLEELIAER